jgi:hypothetical protein
MSFPTDWYWVVNGSTTQVYSTAAGAMVSISSPAYLAWLEAGNIPSPAASKAELGDTLAPYSLRPTDADVLDGYQDSQSRKLSLEVVAKVLFNYANEIRALKGQAPINAAQFRAFVKGLM